MTDDLTDYFETYLKKESIFANRNVLTMNYIPGEIKHRDEQLNQIGKILAPALRNEKPSNLFLYGKTGTGKTLAMRYTQEKMDALAKKNSIPFKSIYVNCKLKKIADTEYRMIAELARTFGKTIPPTGLPTDEVYRLFFDAIEEHQGTILLILDEIDQLVKRAGDEIIYNLTRIMTKNSHIAIIGISNDLLFVNQLDPRVKSSLSEEELIFPPYNAIQIQDILRSRAQMAFIEGRVEVGVIEKCAAFAAREHGDARRAIELLRVAAELAERNNDLAVTIRHLDEAEDKIERDRIVDAVKTQPRQFQAVIYAILSLKKPDAKEDAVIFTGEIYERYKSLCDKLNLRPLTQRRVSDILAELDMLGVINAKVISKGRFGRTREITLSLAESVEERLRKTLEEELA
jgi:archaeal cell division control protein 6